VHPKPDGMADEDEAAAMIFSLASFFD